MSGRTLDDYAAQDVRKLFGTRVKVAATVNEAAAHIDHAVKIVGINLRLNNVVALSVNQQHARSRGKLLQIVGDPELL